MPISKLLTAALLVLTPIASFAQSHPLVGKWNIEYVGGMRMENEESTPIMMKALLTIAQVGDSLVGTIHVEPMPDMPPRPEGRMAALKVAGDEQRFMQRSEAKLNMNGDERTVVAISTWILKADGDALTGNLSREIEGVDFTGAPMAVTGRRIP